jgi:Uma2 family endonuclease
MQAAAIQYFTREDYFAFEETSEEKHEFFRGEIFAMAGGTFNHARISGKTFSALEVKLRGKPCQPTNSDMKIETPKGLITYPDAAVFCGKPELTANQCALLNPVVIIEVLSPSTRRYDQSDKFLLYRSIETFKDYILIDSEKVHVQHFRKTEQHEWILHEYVDLKDEVYLVSIQETLSLSDIYENIVF